MRSLINPNNFTRFECLISTLDFSPHIMAVNELGKNLTQQDSTKM